MYLSYYTRSVLSHANVNLCLFTFRWLSKGVYYTKCHVLHLCLEWICKNHKRSRILLLHFFFQKRLRVQGYIEFNCVCWGVIFPTVQDFIHGERSIYSNIYVEIYNHFIKGIWLTKYIFRFLWLFNWAWTWIYEHSIKHNTGNNIKHNFPLRETIGKVL